MAIHVYVSDKSESYSYSSKAKCLQVLVILDSLDLKALLQPLISLIKFR